MNGVKSGSECHARGQLWFEERLRFTTRPIISSPFEENVERKGGDWRGCLNDQQAK